MCVGDNLQSSLVEFGGKIGIQHKIFDKDVWIKKICMLLYGSIDFFAGIVKGLLVSENKRSKKKIHNFKTKTKIV